MRNRNSSLRGKNIEKSLVEGARYTLRNLEGPFTFICTLSIPTGESGFPGVMNEPYFIFKDTNHKYHSFRESSLILAHKPIKYVAPSQSQPKCTAYDFPPALEPETNFFPNLVRSI